MERFWVAAAWFVGLAALVAVAPLPGWAAFLCGLWAGGVAVWQYGLWAYEATKRETVIPFTRGQHGKEA